MHNIIIIL